MTMQLELIGWMAGFSLKLIISSENIVRTSNVDFLLAIVHQLFSRLSHQHPINSCVINAVYTRLKSNKFRVAQRTRARRAHVEERFNPRRVVSVTSFLHFSCFRAMQARAQITRAQRSPHRLLQYAFSYYDCKQFEFLIPQVARCYSDTSTDCQ